MQEDPPPEVREGDADHDDEGADHEALRPSFEGHLVNGRRLGLLGRSHVVHVDSKSVYFIEMTREQSLRGVCLAVW